MLFSLSVDRGRNQCDFLRLLPLITDQTDRTHKPL